MILPRIRCDRLRKAFGVFRAVCQLRTLATPIIVPVVNVRSSGLSAAFMSISIVSNSDSYWASLVLTVVQALLIVISVSVWPWRCRSCPRVSSPMAAPRPPSSTSNPGAWESIVIGIVHLLKDWYMLCPPPICFAFARVYSAPRPVCSTSRARVGAIVDTLVVDFRVLDNKRMTRP